jgi:hypothetical protein
MKRVIIESPFAGRGPDEESQRIDNLENINYARACVRHCILRGEAPIASHLLYTQDGILKDGVHQERMLGIQAGLSWFRAAEQIYFFTDRGWSKGMIGALEFYKRNNVLREKIAIKALEPNGRKIPEALPPHLLSYVLDIFSLDK